MKYKIRYVETLEKFIEIEAESQEAAIEEVKYSMDNEPWFFDDLEMADNHFEIMK